MRLRAIYRICDVARRSRCNRTVINRHLSAVASPQRDTPKPLGTASRAWSKDRGSLLRAARIILCENGSRREVFRDYSLCP